MPRLAGLQSALAQLPASLLPRKQFHHIRRACDAQHLQTLTLLLAARTVATPEAEWAKRPFVLSVKARQVALSPRETAVALLQGISVLELVATGDIVPAYPVIVLADFFEDRSQFTEHCMQTWTCLLYTSPSPRDGLLSRMPSSA